MFGALFDLIYLGVTVVAGLVAFQASREFVRRRLRFVDGARHPLMPWLAGLGVAIVALPVAGLLPIVTATTAVVTGAAAGLGTASGVKAIRSGEI
jgi:hypothetical protein